MNKGLSVVLIVIAVIVAAGALPLAGMAIDRNASAFAGGWPTMMTNGFLGGGFGQAGRFGGTGPGMMQGHGTSGFRGGMTPAPAPGAGVGYGVLGSSSLSNVSPLTLEQAEAAVQDYLASLGDEDLSLGEIMIFDNHAYAQIVEADTGFGAQISALCRLESGHCPRRGRYGARAKSDLPHAPRGTLIPACGDDVAAGSQTRPYGTAVAQSPNAPESKLPETTYPGPTTLGCLGWRPAIGGFWGRVLSPGGRYVSMTRRS